MGEIIVLIIIIAIPFILLDAYATAKKEKKEKELSTPQEEKGIDTENGEAENT